MFHAKLIFHLALRLAIIVRLIVSGLLFFFGLVFQLARGQRKEVSETETSFVGNINSEQALKIKSLPMSLTDRNSLLCVT